MSATITFKQIVWGLFFASVANFGFIASTSFNEALMVLNAAYVLLFGTVLLTVYGLIEFEL